jgi:hypothetical protein
MTLFDLLRSFTDLLNIQSNAAPTLIQQRSPLKYDKGITFSAKVFGKRSGSKTPEEPSDLRMEKAAPCAKPTL